MKRVAVVHEDGRVLRTYDIDLGDLDREPQVHWYFKQARENAIADKLVTESEANRIRCRFVDDLGEEKASEHPAAQASFLARKDAAPAVTKPYDDADQSRSEAPNLEQRRIARIAKITAWVAAITVAIGAVIAISNTLSSP
jgi:Na+-transporting NADH:ubiquinone oxidoreductase subunit NqrC